MKELTQDDLRKWFDEILKESNIRSNKINIMQRCIERGPVRRTETNLNLCNNKQCPSCMMYHELIKENIKNYKK